MFVCVLNLWPNKVKNRYLHRRLPLSLLFIFNVEIDPFDFGFLWSSETKASSLCYGISRVDFAVQHNQKYQKLHERKSKPVNLKDPQMVRAKNDQLE